MKQPQNKGQPQTPTPLGIYKVFEVFYNDGSVEPIRLLNEFTCFEDAVIYANKSGPNIEIMRNKVWISHYKDKNGKWLKAKGRPLL